MLFYGLYIREFIPLCALDDIVQNKDSSIVARLENEDVLVLRLLVVENLIDLEGHGLTRPHIRDLAEPAICQIKRRGISIVMFPFHRPG